ncbi:hypothetical protein [Magnetococcus sp. PR-3]|uniref:hypothetical protein n=1 Tax=Magnetococcus sp. PR-3 TaxID=3120355 RepID=UPI002FCE4233
MTAYKKLSLVVAIITAPLLLQGCQTMSTAECDPSKGGFMSGAQALSSNCYQRRVDEKDQELSRAQSLREQLEQENMQLESKKDSRAQQVARLRNQLADIERQNHVLARQLSHMKVASRADAQKKRMLEEKLMTLNGQIQSTKVQSSKAADPALAARVEALRLERDQLAEEIAAAMLE